MATESSELSQEAMEAVAAVNIKTVGEGPSFYTNMGYANAISNQQAMDQMRMAIISKATDNIMNTSPDEGAANVALLGQMVKALGLTPAETPAASS